MPFKKGWSLFLKGHLSGKDVTVRANVTRNIAVAKNLAPNVPIIVDVKPALMAK
jgi:hypothetical protein